MISYRDVHSLHGEQHEQMQALIEQRQLLNDVPDTEDGIEAWQAFIEACEEIGFPDYIVSAHAELFRLHRLLGRTDDAIDAFVRMMQVIHAHGNDVQPRKIEMMLGDIYLSTTALLAEPSTPLERVVRMIDLAEAEMERWGVDNAPAAFSRALVAAAAGDANGTYAWIERSQSTGNPEWQANDIANIELEIPLIAKLDPARAAATLERRLAGRGVDLRNIGPDIADDELENPAALLVLLARLYRFTGRSAEADDLVDRLLNAIGLAGLMTEADFDDLVPALEHHPDEALVVVDRSLQLHPYDHTEWRLIAAAARSRILAVPDGEEGALLRALADEAALVYDLRGATDVNRRELAETWWAGLPATPRPAVVDDTEIWGDETERAQLILSAGWFPRIGDIDGAWLAPDDDDTPIDVVPHDPPSALRARYGELLMDCTTLVEMESEKEADALADRLEQRAVGLRCASSRFAIPLFHGTRALQAADALTFLRCYELAQHELLVRGPSIAAAMKASADLAIFLGTALLVDNPSASWEQIDELLRTEARVREATGGRLAPLVMAHATVAAHRGDEEALRGALHELDRLLATEYDRAGRVSFDLEVIGLLESRDPAAAARIARSIVDDGDAEQVRSGHLWLAWLGASADPGGTGARFRRLYDSVEGDVEEFERLPYWLLLEGIALDDGDPRPVLDVLLAKAAKEGDLDYELYAAGAQLLLTRYPGDPRGPELRERALRIVRALDERDGAHRVSARVAARWLADDIPAGSTR